MANLIIHTHTHEYNYNHEEGWPSSATFSAALPLQAFELVTFGHGAKRCIGEKMARAMMTSFLAEAMQPRCSRDAAEMQPR